MLLALTLHLIVWDCCETSVSPCYKETPHHVLSFVCCGQGWHLYNTLHDVSWPLHRHFSRETVGDDSSLLNLCYLWFSVIHQAAINTSAKVICSHLWHHCLGSPDFLHKQHKLHTHTHPLGLVSALFISTHGDVSFFFPVGEIVQTEVCSCMYHLTFTTADMHAQTKQHAQT